MAFEKYPKIYAFGHEETKGLLSNPESMIVIEEKIDGANFRFMFKDGNIIFGTRTQQMTSSTGEEVNIKKNFRRCVDFVKSSIPRNKIKLYEGIIFFGENIVKHTMGYDWERIPPYLGFDIMEIESGRMLRFDESKEIFAELNLDFVPVVDVVQSENIKKIDESIIPVSCFAPNNKPDMMAEGVVLKNYDSQIMAKIVNENFKEKNTEVFGGIPKFQENDSGKIIARYCTNSRIEKIIFKLVDEDYKLEMALMKMLPHMVNDDIWGENWQEIVSKYKEIKPNEIKKMIIKRCRVVLNQVLINNALEKDNG